MAARAGRARSRDGSRDDPGDQRDHRSAPARPAGVGSALNDLSREVGGAIGIAVIGSILTSTYSSHVDLTGLSSRVAAEVKSVLRGRLAPRRRDLRPRAHRVRHAMHIALLTGAGAALLAALATLILLARQPAGGVLRGVRER